MIFQKSLGIVETLILLLIHSFTLQGFWSFCQLLMYFQVQLRLQQVVGAPPENRENLLKELEQFAFRGVPNLSSPRIPETLQSQEENPETQSSRAEDLQPVSFCLVIMYVCTMYV